MGSSQCKLRPTNKTTKKYSIHQQFGDNSSTTTIHLQSYASRAADIAKVNDLRVVAILDVTSVI